MASSIHSHVHPLRPNWYLLRKYWEKNQTWCVALVWQTTPHCVPKYFKTLLLSAYINVTFWHIYAHIVFTRSNYSIQYINTSRLVAKISVSLQTGKHFWRYRRNYHILIAWTLPLTARNTATYRNCTDALLMPGSFCCWLTAWRCLTLMGEASPEAKAAIKEQCIKFAARICNRE